MIEERQQRCEVCGRRKLGLGVAEGVLDSREDDAGLGTIKGVSVWSVL